MSKCTSQHHWQQKIILHGVSSWIHKWDLYFISKMISTLNSSKRSLLGVNILPLRGSSLPIWVHLIYPSSLPPLPTTANLSILKEIHAAIILCPVGHFLWSQRKKIAGNNTKDNLLKVLAWWLIPKLIPNTYQVNMSLMHLLFLAKLPLLPFSS